MSVTRPPDGPDSRPAAPSDDREDGWYDGAGAEPEPDPDSPSPALGG
ncbi:hypothetical protein [Streptomyces griseorubiginosus]